MSRAELCDHVTEHWDELVEAGKAPPVPPPSETWLTRSELADRWKMPTATLDQWGSQGRGPKYARFGRHVRYRLSDVIRWENRQFDDEPDSPARDAPDAFEQEEATSA